MEHRGSPESRVVACVLRLSTHVKFRAVIGGVSKYRERANISIQYQKLSDMF
jgi:hypothetical protein